MLKHKESTQTIKAGPLFYYIQNITKNNYYFHIIKSDTFIMYMFFITLICAVVYNIKQHLQWYQRQFWFEEMWNMNAYKAILMS